VAVRTVVRLGQVVTIDLASSSCRSTRSRSRSFVRSAGSSFATTGCGMSTQSAPDVSFVMSATLISAGPASPKIQAWTPVPGVFSSALDGLAELLVPRHPPTIAARPCQLTAFSGDPSR
jgi:hypothetical protein